MCGIAGIMSNNERIDFDRVGERLTQSLRHRGPDDNGIMADRKHGCLFVHTRLSILDLTQRGHQPMHDVSGRYSIVFNGEIYNFKEIRDELKKSGIRFGSGTDTEVVLQAYIHWQEQCLSRLRGMFAFGIVDRDPAGTKLFLARDRFGIKPLIYSQTPNGFVFASELRALTDAGLIDRKISSRSLGQYLACGSVQQPDTIYKGVYQLMAGHCMVVTPSGDLQLNQWYDVAARSVELARLYRGKSYCDLVDLTRIKLEEAAQYHVIADVEVGAFLSGGVDSSAVTALMRRHLPGKIQTFSVGFEPQNEVMDEKQAARVTARFIEAEHHELIVTHQHVDQMFDPFINSLDQPSVDGFNTFLVSGIAGKRLKVTLSGLAGDELFGGYTYYQDIFKLRKIPIPFIGRIAEGRIPVRLLKGLSYYGLTPYQAVGHFRQYHSWDWLRKVAFKDFETPLLWGEDESGLDDLARMGLADLNGYLCSTLLRDCDVLSMAHSLEVRPVLLDHCLVEHALALPDRAKIRNGKKKSVFLDAVAGLIPPGCGQRKKTGFELPFRDWMRGPLKERFRQAFDSQAARDLFKNSFRQATVQKLDKNRLRRWDWQWFVLLSWLDRNRVDLQ